MNWEKKDNCVKHCRSREHIRNLLKKGSLNVEELSVVSYKSRTNRSSQEEIQFVPVGIHQIKQGRPIKYSMQACSVPS